MSSKIRNILILSTILGCGIILRLPGLFHTLEYDEIWTLQTFLDQSLRRIFSDFALPNNHPLNTVAVCLAYFGRECAWTIRLGAFFASIGTILAGYFLVRRLSGKQAGIFAALALAVLPPFVTAGCSARGYSGQLLFLILTALFLLKSKKSYLWPVLALLSGILAAISLPTSILWLFPLGSVILLRAIKKKSFRDRRLYIISVIGIFNAAWLLYHLTSYLKGTVFQIPLTTTYGYIEYFFNIFSANGFPLWFILILSLLQFRKKLYWSLLYSLLFAPLVTLLTTPGPARVYLPSGAVGIMVTAVALPTLLNRIRKNTAFYRALLSILLLVPVYFTTRNSIRREPDWKMVHRIIAALPPSMLPCFNSVNGFPAQWNCPELSREFINRLIYCSQQQHCSLLIAGEELSGIGADGATVALPMPETALRHVEKNIVFHTLNLKLTQSLPPGKFAIILLPVQPTPQLNAAVKYLLGTGCRPVLLNSFMTMSLQIPGQDIPYRYRMFAIISGSALRSSPGIKIFVPER